MKLPAAPKDSTFRKAPWNKKAGGGNAMEFPIFLPQVEPPE